MLTERQSNILGLVVDNYIKTAEPVGSKFLVENTSLDMSGATIRNEMRELEEMGYLNHPHTSAGRVPTELGYRYYITNVMQPVLPKKKVQDELLAIKQNQTKVQEQYKETAKYLASYMGGAVIVSFSDETLYYTGLSNLFSQPEFHDFARTIALSAVFDECEQYMIEVLDQVQIHGPSVMLGSNNPIGDSCGTVVLKVDGNVIVAVGPMRMPYRKTVGILEFLRHL
jgi:transcriptional regulator of heat shock response